MQCYVGGGKVLGAKVLTLLDDPTMCQHPARQLAAIRAIAAAPEITVGQAIEAADPMGNADRQQRLAGIATSAAWRN